MQYYFINIEIFLQPFNYYCISIYYVLTYDYTVGKIMNKNIILLLNEFIYSYDFINR